MALQATGKYLLLKPLKKGQEEGLAFQGAGEVPKGVLLSIGSEIGATEAGYVELPAPGATILYKPHTGLVISAEIIAVEWQDVLAYEPPGEVSS